MVDNAKAVCEHCSQLISFCFFCRKRCIRTQFHSMHTAIVYMWNNPQGEAGFNYALPADLE